MLKKNFFITKIVQVASESFETLNRPVNASVKDNKTGYKPRYSLS